MRLINPKGMSEKQKRELRLCLKSQKLSMEREKLIACVAEGMANIEEGVRIIDQNLPIPRLGYVDLVAEDVRGRLVLIAFADGLDPEGLGQAMIRADWAAENLDLLSHFYSRDFPSEVRSWQMVEEVAPEAASLVSRMDRLPAEVFTCEGMELSDDRWLIVRRLEAAKVVSESMSFHPDMVEQRGGRRSVMRNPRDEEEVIHKIGQPSSVLTREEIDDFFDKSVYEDEVTSRVLDSSK
jgi:hypothetical protein